MRHALQAGSSSLADVARALVVVALAAVTTGCSVVGVRTVEEASYEVLRKEDRFELLSAIFAFGLVITGIV